MLAAASERFGNLEPVRILFSLARSHPDQVPQPLIDQALLIIRQARDLYADPTGTNENTLPEAISLALIMRRDKELAKDLAQINSFDHLDPAKAASALEHLSAAFVD
jgi:hypothetical protein